MSPVRFARPLLMLSCAIGIAAPPLAAQASPRGPDSERAIDAFVFRMLQTMKVKDAPAIAPLIDALLSDTAGHMRAAPKRVATAADSARAREVVQTLRTELAPFRDVAAAERAGYERFMPWLEEQAIYHYNSLPNAIAAADSFHVTRPSSLLYRKGADGRLVLVGVMYTAPSRASFDELNARLPIPSLRFMWVIVRAGSYRSWGGCPERVIIYLTRAQQGQAQESRASRRAGRHEAPDNSRRHPQERRSG